MKTERILKILFSLLEGEFCKVDKLAYKFDVSEKTIYRDIDFLKECGIPIDNKMGSGYYINDSYELKRKKLSKKEKSELNELIATYKKIPEIQMKELLENVSDKFVGSFNDWLSVKFYDERLEANFEKIKKAVINSNIIEINIDGNKKKVKPYKIFLEKGIFYLFYYTDDEKNILDIKLDDVDEIKILNDKFLRKKN